MEENILVPKSFSFSKNNLNTIRKNEMNNFGFNNSDKIGSNDKISENENNNFLRKRSTFEVQENKKEILSKNERRNKHCKMDFDWLSKETEEKSKKKNIKSKDNNKKTQNQTTKFLLTRNKKGVDLNQIKNLNQNQKILENNQIEKKEVSPKNISLKMDSTGTIKLQINNNQPKNRYSCSLPSEKPIISDPKRNSSFFNNPNSNPKMVWNSRGQCDEEVKLISKINKVRTYWASTSLLIPNVFRHVCELPEEPEMLFEYLDLSKKELLVQANGQKAVSQAGAPHLQRKNKSSVKSKKDDRKSEISSQKNIIKLNSSISVSVKDKNNTIDNLVLNDKKEKDGKINFIEKKNENLENEEELNKKEIEVDIKNNQNWNNQSLEEFNNKLAEYNLLLEKEEKLKKNGKLKNELIAEMKDIYLGNKEQKFNLNLDENKNEKEQKNEILFKEILKIESSFGKKLPNEKNVLMNSPKLKKTKKIIKPEKLTFPKIKQNLNLENSSNLNLAEENNNQKEFDVSKNEKEELEKETFPRKESENENILEISRDEELEVTIHDESFLELTEESIDSLEEHKRKITFKIEEEKCLTSRDVSQI